MPEKKAILNLRLDPKTRDQFAIAAKLRGASMSGLLHQFIIRTIREERQAFPAEFESRHKAPIVARIGGKDAIQRDLEQGIPYGGTIKVGPQKKRKAG